MAEYLLPDVGEGLTEAEIVAWKVKVGDTVKLDQPIVEIMTDKATVEIPSPRAGTIAKINYTEGQICPVGQVLLVIDDGKGAAAAPAAAHGSNGNGKGHHGPSTTATSKPSPAGELQILSALYAADFGLPGALRLQDVNDGRVGFYDTYYPAGQGQSARGLLAARHRLAFARAVLSSHAYLQARRLRLRENFTGFLLDPVSGDGRTSTGVSSGNRPSRAKASAMISDLSCSCRSYRTCAYTMPPQAGSPWTVRLSGEGRSTAVRSA